VKIKVIELGDTEFAADDEFTEPDIRAALALKDPASRDEAVRSAIYDNTDGVRDTSPEEHITITEDDGTLLWSGWLTGDKDKPAPDVNEYRDAIVEILTLFDDDPQMTEELLAVEPGQRTAESAALAAIREIGRTVLEGRRG